MCGAFTIWMDPSLILTESRLSSLVEKIPGVTFDQKPAFIHLSINHLGLTGKRIKLELGKFCLKEPESCFEAGSVNFEFRLTGLTHVELMSLGPIALKNEFLKVVPTEEKQEKKKDSEKSSFDLSQHLSLSPQFKMADVSIDFPKVTLGKQTEADAISFKLEAPTQDQIQTNATYAQKSGLKAAATLVSSLPSQGLSPIQIKFEASKKWGIDGILNGNFAWKDLAIHLTGNLELKKLIPWIDTLKLKNIQLNRDPNLSLSADVDGQLEPRLVAMNADSAMPKASFGMDVAGKLEIKQNKDRFPFTLKVGPVAQKGVVIQSSIEGEYPLAIHELHLSLKVDEFHQLVESLKRTNAAIPTPFNSMYGKIDLEIGSDTKKTSSNESIEIPITLSTELKSKEQEFTTHSKGSLKMSSQFKDPKLTGETELNLVRLTLAKFDPLAFNVALTRDSRILLPGAKITPEIKTKKAESPSAFDYSWKIHSEKDAIQIFYPVLVPHAPLQINWTVSNQKATGELNVLPFEIRFMNRDAKLDSFRYYLSANDPKAHYRGKLIVAKTEYTVSLEVFDEDGKPKVVLASAPPLEDSDIVSVLLFNQTSAELTPDESSSVTNTQAAIANRALGLFSLWALSSTPVEAVSYNPSTHVYSARVKLANGLTATIGTDWENAQQVELRKRLGKNFVLSTILETQTDAINGETDSKKALIEWFKRF